MPRCFGDGDPLYERYHDEEWGFPVTDERGLFERMSLEAFQSGLSWRTILNKRESFRAAFKDFDPDVVARFGARDVTRLMKDAGIVRNRLKIEATINNAKATVAMRKTDGTLDQLILSHVPRPAKREDAVPATTAESVALAKELKKRGFRFVGPTTVYALMQATGIVNDHGPKCPIRPKVQKARRAAGLMR